MASYRRRDVLNLAGLDATGKTTIALHLRDKYGFEIYSPDDLIEEFAKKRGLPLESLDQYQRAQAKMTKKNKNAVVQPVLESSADKIVIDGLRTFRDALLLSDSIDYRYWTLTLEAPADVRYEREKQDNTGRANVSPEVYEYRTTAEMRNLTYKLDYTMAMHNLVTTPYPSFSEKTPPPLNTDRPLEEVLADVEERLIYKGLVQAI